MHIQFDEVRPLWFLRYAREQTSRRPGILITVLRITAGGEVIMAVDVSIRSDTIMIRHDTTRALTMLDSRYSTTDQ